MCILSGRVFLRFHPLTFSRWKQDRSIPTWPQWRTLKNSFKVKVFRPGFTWKHSAVWIRKWLPGWIEVLKYGTSMCFKKAWGVTCLKLPKSLKTQPKWKFFCSLKKSRQSWVEVGKVYDWKKNHQSGPKILCPRLALDDLGSGEAGNCFGAVTIENWQKILSDLKTFYSYAWMVHETSIFSIFPPRIMRHASHTFFRSKALRRLIFLGTRHPVRRKWSNILGPVEVQN